MHFFMSVSYCVRVLGGGGGGRRRIKGLADW